MLKRPDNIFLIGAMKAGTTTLFAMLQSHPAICVPFKKEPNTLLDPSCTTDAQFLGAFPGLKSHHRYVLDASTSYSKKNGRNGVPEKIAALNGETKLIYLLRNPFERTRSHYYHKLARCPEDIQTLEQDEFLHCVNVSRYSEQLAAFEKVGLTDRLLMLDFENLVANPIKTFNRTIEFLGLEQSNIAPPTEARNVSNLPKDRDHLMDWNLMRERLTREQRLMREKYGFRPGTPWSIE